jgi:hypothetical protein
MLINSVSAGTGVRWLRDGGRLLKRQPLGLPAMVVVYLMMLLVPAMIPLVGIAVSGVLGPFATVGLMQCFRDAAAGRPPGINQFGQSFRDPVRRLNLFRLGLINAALLMAVAMLAALVLPESAGEAPPQTVEQLPVQALLVQLLLYSPVMALMWFAPLLAGWHDMTPGKAMFGSAVACFRNLGALLVYGLAVLALTMGVSVVLMTLVSALVSSPEVMSFFVAPIALVLMTIVQGSFYPMYLSIFSSQAPAPD